MADVIEEINLSYEDWVRLSVYPVVEAILKKYREENTGWH